MTPHLVKSKWERGEHFRASFRILYGVNKLTGHKPMSAFVKAALNMFGFKTRYYPRRWQRLI